MVAQKLYRADYHGAEMTVTRSNCYSLVGASGIVVMETKFCFKLLGKDNIVRSKFYSTQTIGISKQSFQNNIK